MVPAWCFGNGSMVLSWCAHGVPMVSAWVSREVLQWCVCRVPMTRLLIYWYTTAMGDAGLEASRAEPWPSH